MQVIDVPDCGNAPRTAIVRDVVVQLCDRDADAVCSWLADDFEWVVLGERVLTDRDSVDAWIGDMPPAHGVEFTSILTPGKEASVDGVVTVTNGARRAFCHVLRFTGAAKTARIARVRTYLRDV